MLNKDKRSLLLSLVLGDGCLHYVKRKNHIYGALTITHGLKQADYQAWKAKLLSEICGRDVRVRPFNNNTASQVSVCMKRLRAWRKFIYRNNKKSLPLILKFIRHPEFALAVWLMDDGYVEPSITNGKVYNAGFRIFTCDQNPEEQAEIQKWLLTNFGVDSKIRYSKHSKNNKSYPFIKINQTGALVIWEKIREFVLTIKSMQYKFRHIEYIYQNKLLQRTPVNTD